MRMRMCACAGVAAGLLIVVAASPRLGGAGASAVNGAVALCSWLVCLVSMVLGGHRLDDITTYIFAWVQLGVAMDVQPCSSVPSPPPPLQPWLTPCPSVLLSAPY